MKKNWQGKKNERDTWFLSPGHKFASQSLNLDVLIPKFYPTQDENGPARPWPPWPQGQFLRPWVDPNQHFAYGFDGPMGITDRLNQTYAYVIISDIII